MAKRTEHRWAVEGIEEGIARIEEDGERMISVPVHLLPPGTKAGQLLRMTGDAGDLAGAAGCTIVLDEAGTLAAQRQSKAFVDATLAESKKRDPGGDVSL